MMWSVWSKMPTDDVWLEVGEDLTKRDATDAVERKRVAAERLHVTAEFVALPKGRVPR